MNKYVFDLLKSYPDNTKIMEDVLNEIKYTSFAHLYKTQLALTSIHRFDIDINKCIELDSNDMKYSIPFEFIPIEYIIKYRVSSLYKKWIKYDNIVENPDLFPYIIMIYIDGVLDNSISIQPFEDIIDIKISKDIYTNILANQYNISVMIMPNRYESVNYTMNLQSMQNINNLRGFIRTTQFKAMNSLEPEKEFLTWVSGDSTGIDKYHLIDHTIVDGYIKLDSDQLSKIGNIRGNIKLTYIKNCYSRIDISSDEEYFQIDMLAMPVPTEQIILFENNGDYLKFDHNSTIDMYYPNIYKVNRSHNNPIVAYVIYDSKQDMSTPYINELRLYHRFMGDIVSRYRDETVSDIVKLYTPIKVDYSIKDYQNSDIDNTLDYKIEKLKSLIPKELLYYKLYLNKIAYGINEFYIDISKIDLKTRIRYNNHLEVQDADLQESFGDPHYLMVFRYNKDLTFFNFFIDGVNTVPKSYHIGKLLYVYIPVDDLRSDSIIEIEKFYDRGFKTLVDTITDYFKIDIRSTSLIPGNQLFLIYEDENGDLKYVDKSKYTLYHYSNNKYDVIDDESFMPYKTVYSKFNTDEFNNTRVYIVSSNNNFAKVFTGQMEIELSEEIINDSKNIQVFKNGRLLSYSAYKITFSEYYKGPHIIKIHVDVSALDNITVIHSQHKRQIVYRLAQIPSTGFIQMDESINKPYSRKWNDIYLNGFKLHSRQINEITSTKFIISSDLSTLHTLVVYQKNLDVISDYNSYPLDTSDIVYDEDEDLQKKIEGEYSDISDDIPDIEDDVIYEIDDFIRDYLLLNIPMINPDYAQLTNQDLYEKYYHLYDENKNIHIEPDVQFNINKDYIFNPDISLE